MASSKWFEKLSPTARQAYLRSHPGSKFKKRPAGPKKATVSKPSTSRKAVRTNKRTSSSLYFVQPGGKWKKGADGRSKGRTTTELKAMGINVNAKRPAKKVGKRRM